MTEIKTAPYAPLSHPFVERLIGTIRREYLDHTLFWTTADLENKLLDFRTYFNQRSHACLTGRANARYARVTSNRKSPLVPIDWMEIRQWLTIPPTERNVPAEVLHGTA